MCYEEMILKALPKDEEDWQILGILNKKNEVLPIGHDSKIIGRLFEIIVKESLSKLGEQLGFELHESPAQTIYPDFYFVQPNGRRIAIDIKTTYRRSTHGKYSFTGGSFTSFLRDNRKNIAGTYDQYDKHYIIGIVYTRNKEASIDKADINLACEIIPAYYNIEYFVQEKYRVCGDKKGSGNTDNIGTIKSNKISTFQEGKGPFYFLGENIFHDYWRHYPKYKDSKKKKETLYVDIPSYIKWVRKNVNKDLAEMIQTKYDKYEIYKSKLTE